MGKIKIGILGATGMVGQRLVTLLANHPWFEVKCLAASASSAGERYADAVEGRWKIKDSVPEYSKNMILKKAEEDAAVICDNVELVFSALGLEKEKIMELEENYASRGIAVVSNNSAHRWTDDVPMIIPEVNPEHANLIGIQRKNRGWKKGLIAVKPNCSIQSYVPVIKALEDFKPQKIVVTTLQAISGAGKTFDSWPEILDNAIPFIQNEEEKSEKEPLKVLGKMGKNGIKMANSPKISATCIRVPAADGHMASVEIGLGEKTTEKKIIEAINDYKNPIADLNLPSCPKHFMKYFEEDDRPQTKLDRNLENGMGISVGRLRKGDVLGWKFVSLSHNTIRGAAGGAILTAELLKKKGYL